MIHTKKGMGFYSVLALVIGAQLGTGTFLLPGQLSPYGIWGILSWAITGTGALVLSFVFAMFSRMRPTAGGPHVYIQEAFGSKTGLIAAWTYWLISWISSIPVVLLYAGALEHISGPFTPTIRLLIEIGTLIIIMGLNLRGVSLSGGGEIFFSALKVLPMVLIPLWAVSFWKADLIIVPSSISPLKALNNASLLTFWGYIGLECGTTVASCVRRPETTIPRALLMGSLVVTFIYVLNTLIIMGIVPAPVLQASPSPYSELLEVLFGPWGSKIMSILIVIMCLGTLNSWLLTSGQIASVAGQERLFPTFFSYENRFRSPYYGIILTTVLLCACVMGLRNHTLQQQLDLLIHFSTALFIMLYLAVTAALAKLMWQGDIQGPRYMWGAIFLSFGFCLWALAAADLYLFAVALLILAMLGFRILKAQIFR